MQSARLQSEHHKVVGLEDWLICAATFFTMNQCWSSYVYFHYGYIGVRAVDIRAHDEARALLYSWLAVVFYTPILPLVKTSILRLFLRLGGRQRTGVRMAIYLLITLTTLQIIAFVFVTIFQCTPLNLAWSTLSQERQGLQCINRGVFTLSVASWNIFTDLLMLTLPYRIFLDIKTNKKMRTALTGLFMLGTVVTVFSAVRLYYMYRFYFTVSPDPTYSLGYILSAVESNLAIIAASIPALLPLARLWFPCMETKFGINQHYQADIEVQTLGDGDGTTRIASPAKVKVTWARAKASPNGSAVLGKSRNGSSVLAAMSEESTAAEGQCLDGLMLPSPLKHALERRRGEEDYFGNFESREESVRDSYHSMISTPKAGQGHVSPWRNACEAYDEALHKGEHARFESSGGTTACALSPPDSSTLTLTLPQRANKSPVEKL